MDTIEPDYIHEILVVIIPETNVDQVISSNNIKIQGKVTTLQEKYIDLSTKFMAAMIESGSNGKFQIKITVEKPKIILYREIGL